MQERWGKKVIGSVRADNMVRKAARSVAAQGDKTKRREAEACFLVLINLLIDFLIS